jgi:hypothetical protein
VLYVGEEAAAQARDIEQRFAHLPPEAGILFVSVGPQPTEDGKTVEFFIRLGIQRSLTEGAGRALVQQVLEQEIQSGLKVYAGVYRGVSGACRDDGSAAARPTAS